MFLINQKFNIFNLIGFKCNYFFIYVRPLDKKMSTQNLNVKPF
jgi:hypothetical protein